MRKARSGIGFHVIGMVDKSLKVSIPSARVGGGGVLCVHPSTICSIPFPSVCVIDI